ncbi:MAG: glycoside hydrolase family 2 TIM barrel-domain containing protein, partial [Bryobacteraceae bacterium]
MRITRRTVLGAAASAIPVLRPPASAQQTTPAVGRGAAMLPAGDELTWGKEPIEDRTSRRATICLNGIWQAMPAVNEARLQPAADWGYIRVPGGWQDNGNRMPGIVAAGSGSPWQDFNGSQVSRMWYQRPISVPADWAGRAVLLDFDRLSTDARVFVNDQECGEAHWPDGAVDITRAVTPGKEATLRVLVVAAPEESAVAAMMAGNESAPAVQPQAGAGRGAAGAAGGLPARGLTGDVLLRSRPAGPHIDSIYVRTSTRQKQFALEVELTGVAQSGNVHVTAVALDEKGREERRFEADLPVRAAATQIVRPVWSWANPRLWDIGQPNLYTLALKVQGAGLDDEMKQTFGFREFWIDGRNYYLNGAELRMRPVMGQPQARAAEEMDGHIDAFKWAGYNFQEIWPNDESARGMPDTYQMWYARADLKGWPISAVLENFRSYAPTWSDPQTVARYRAAGAAQIKRYRNHPSIIMWNTSPNYSRGDQLPRIIGNCGKAWNKLGEWTDGRFPKLQEAIEILRSLDGTRPVISHHCGSVGDVYTLNLYMLMMPLQEREEYLSYWAAFGDMPFYVVEFGAPLQFTYHRGRNGYEQASTSEAWATEFCAIYFGKRAYTGELPEYRAQMPKLFQKDQTYGSWQDFPGEIFAPNVQQVQELFIRNTWRSWRTMGNTGGTIPWSNGHGWARSADGNKVVEMAPFTPGRRGYYFHTARMSNLHWLDPQAARMMPAGKALVENNQATL